MTENQEVKKCPIINNKLTRQDDTSPTPVGVWEKKKKSIIKIQKYAIRFFNKDLAKKHYTKERLKYFTIAELTKLELWFKVELEKTKGLVYKRPKSV